MRGFIAGVLLILWMCFTLALAVTIVGMVVVIEEKWQDIPAELIKLIQGD
jgi:hypothetical protein